MVLTGNGSKYIAQSRAKSSDNMVYNGFDDLTGQVFGELTAIRFNGVRKITTDKNVYYRPMWICKCSCGDIINVRKDSLLNGNTRSCGHLIKSNHVVTHRQSYTKLYHVWASMKNRCKNEHDKNYRHYGGRGITYAPEWENYEPFYTWSMENGYEIGLTIDRIDNDGPYAPWNCRWVDVKVQQSNHRERNLNIQIEYMGKTQNLNKWCKELGCNYGTAYGRYRKGIRDPEKIFARKV